ncbi:MAG: cytochrome b/b6 domain-containing protein [Chloroflexi bacterium]|nr:cytochrome b/b6 domain-containing protein [Chloroflexota bacterium]
MSNSVVSKASRYHPISVILHWAVVLLMFAAVLFAGDDGGGNLGLHTLVGGIILALMLIRFAMRWIVKQPEWASTGNSFLDLVGKLTHFALYFFTFSILATGAFLFLNGGQGGFLIGTFHALSWFALFLLIVLHVGAAFYHQFFIKDNLLGRMWFGRQTE